MRLVDTALYEAKHSGRNCVVAARSSAGGDGAGKATANGVSVALD